MVTRTGLKRYVIRTLLVLLNMLLYKDQYPGNNILPLPWSDPTAYKETDVCWCFGVGGGHELTYCQLQSNLGLDLILNGCLQSTGEATVPSQRHRGAGCMHRCALCPLSLARQQAHCSQFIETDIEREIGNAVHTSSLSSTLNKKHHTPCHSLLLIHAPEPCFSLLC